jgi:hypothetical protein
MYYRETYGAFMVFATIRVKAHNIHITDGFTIPYLIVETHGRGSTPVQSIRRYLKYCVLSMGEPVIPGCLPVYLHPNQIPNSSLLHTLPLDLF